MFLWGDRKQEGNENRIERTCVRKGIVVFIFLPCVHLGGKKIERIVIIRRVLSREYGLVAASLSNVAPWITTIGARMLDYDFPIYIMLGNDENYTGIMLYSGDPSDGEELVVDAHLLLVAGITND